MRINYRTQKSELRLALYVPDSLKRKVAKVKVPAYQNFVVSEMIDESFSVVLSAWKFDRGNWILEASSLPPGERYLLKLIGEVPGEILSDIIRIQPAQNRDQTSEIDRYWLHSMIKNVDFIKQIYREVEVDDVNVNVHVGIERCFSTTFPKGLKKLLKASQRWTRAGYSRDRNEIQRAWLDATKNGKENTSMCV